MHRVVLPILFGVLLAPVAAGHGPEESAGDSLAIVKQFAERFMRGEHAGNLDGMTDVMRAASGPGPSEKLRQGLHQQFGELVRIGDAWHQDTVQGYRRFRIPIDLENAKLDFRVVLDGSSLIAGFFVVPRVEPPPETGDEKPRGPEIDLTVGDSESGLPGTLTLPDGPGPFAAVVLVHGSGPNDRDETIGPNKPLRDLAWGLAERGIAVLRYDKRSFARPGDLAALGDGLTVEHEAVADARSAVRLLAERDEIDGSRIFVLGHSLGGTLLPRIGAMQPRPAGLVSLAGMTRPLPEKMLEQSRYIAAADGQVTAAEQTQLAAIETQVRSLRAALAGEAPDPTEPLLGAPIGYYRDLERHDPPAEAAKLRIPILVLQGKRDYQVTMDDFALWRETLQGKTFACLVAYDGLDHLFRKGEGSSTPQDYERAAPFEPRVLDDIAAWIRTRRCP